MEPLPTNDVLVLNDISDGAFWFDSLGEGDLAELLRLAEPELGADAASVQPNSNEPGHHSNCALELDETTAAPAAKSKRRGRKKTVTAEERRRKNREIQARYRANQRAKQAELEGTHADTAAELERAELENAVMSRRNAVLESLLSTREAELGAMQAIIAASSPYLEQQQQGTRRDAPQLMAQAEEDAVLPEADAQCGPATEDGIGSTSVPGAIQELFASLSQDLGEAGASGSGSTALQVSAPEVSRSRQQDLHAEQLVVAIKGLTPEQFVANWRSGVLATKRVLDESEELGIELGPCGSSAEERRLWQALIQTTLELSLSLTTALQHNLPASQALFATVSLMGPPEAAAVRCRDIALALHLSVDQQEDAMAVFQEFLDEQAVQRAAKAEMMEALNAAALGPPTSLQGLMQHYVGLFDSAGKLAANPDAEFLSSLKLMREVGRIFTVVQRGKCIALAHPAFPETVLLMTAITQLCQERRLAEAEAEAEAGGGEGAVDMEEGEEESGK